MDEKLERKSTTNPRRRRGLAAAAAAGALLLLGIILATAVRAGPSSMPAARQGFLQGQEPVPKRASAAQSEDNVAMAADPQTDRVQEAEVWTLEELRVGFWHENDIEVTELAPGAGAASTSYEFELPLVHASASVAESIRFSYPRELIEDEPATFAVGGSATAAVEGGTISAYFKVDHSWMSDQGLCPRDQQSSDELADQTAHFSSPMLECTFSAPARWLRCGPNPSPPQQARTRCIGTSSSWMGSTHPR
ncbi:MAG: hypothetical protein ACE5LU_21055 [Anaerolineae bacterium]